MKKTLMLSAAFLMFQAAPVLAEDAAHDGKKMEREIPGDTNGDGLISESEFMARAKERFSSIDANNDGKLSREEAKSAHEKKRAEMKEKKEEWKEKREAKKAEMEAKREAKKAEREAAE